MKWCFIFNPASGRSRRRPDLVLLVREFAARLGPDAAFAITEGPGHATELARAALSDGCERIVAIGGDGTMNETAQALVGSPAALALVPIGSGNGLALHLGLPTRVRPALALAADAAARIITMDTGVANGHPFFNVMGLGFDAELSRRFNLLSRRGLAAYLRVSVGAFFGHRGEPVEVSDGNGTREALQAFLVAISNSEQYGYHALLAPGARVDDGLLDLVAVRPPGIFGALALTSRLFFGTFDHSARVWHLRGARFTVRRAAPGIIHTDGETHETGTPVEISVVPRSLRLVVPAGDPAPALHPATSTPNPPWKRSISASEP